MRRLLQPGNSRSLTKRSRSTAWRHRQTEPHVRKPKLAFAAKPTQQCRRNALLSQAKNFKKRHKLFPYVSSTSTGSQQKTIMCCSRVGLLSVLAEEEHTFSTEALPHPVPCTYRHSFWNATRLFSAQVCLQGVMLCFVLVWHALLQKYLRAYLLSWFAAW